MRNVIITNIRRGTVRKDQPSTYGRDKLIYAEIRDADTGELLVASTMDYITERLQDFI